MQKQFFHEIYCYNFNFSDEKRVATQISMEININTVFQVITVDKYLR